MENSCLAGPNWEIAKRSERTKRMHTIPDKIAAQFMRSVCNERGIDRERWSRCALTHRKNWGLIQMQGRRLVRIPDTGELAAFAGEEELLERAS